MFKIVLGNPLLFFVLWMCFGITSMCYMCWKLVKLTVWVNGVVILCIIFVPCVAVNFLLIKMLNLGVVVVLLFSACFS